MPLLLLHLAATWFMVGLIWFVQVVHYPLYDRVGQTEFAGYEHLHTVRTTWVVLPVMFLELGTGIALLWLRPAGIAGAAVLIGLLLLGAIWASTFLLQVPQHDRLRLGFDGAAHLRLVVTNWLRTAAWSARGLLTLWFLLAAKGFDVPHA